MLTLIAESKMMSLNEETISEEIFKLYTPEFENVAEAIMSRLHSLSPEELSECIKISRQLTQKVCKLIYEFPNKSRGLPALRAFTGEVFKALDIKTISKDGIDFSKSRLLIISSLYGLLTPVSIIKPYRLDFNIAASPDGEILSKFWKPRLTDALIDYIKTTGQKEILNLLPGEAEKCIDWKTIKEYVNVIRPDFKVLTTPDIIRTPHAGYLKELRGLMVRAILEHKIDSLDEILSLSTDKFTPYPEMGKPGYPCYLSI